MISEKQLVKRKKEAIVMLFWTIHTYSWRDLRKPRKSSLGITGLEVWTRDFLEQIKSASQSNAK
jgi:hypothetical protein